MCRCRRCYGRFSNSKARFDISDNRLSARSRKHAHYLGVQAFGFCAFHCLPLTTLISQNRRVPPRTTPFGGSSHEERKPALVYVEEDIASE